MRVAIYGRVSTGHPVEQQTIEQQIERLTAHVGTRAAEGWTLDPTHLFRDDGYSGAALARPGLDRLRDAVKGREVDRVLVTAPDRLARNYVHQMVLLEEWARAGCAVEFLDRPMSDDPHDHLLLQIRGAVAEYERTLIAERMRRGRLAKLRAGTLLPWTYAPYGYRLSPDRPRDPRGVTLDPAEAAVVAELFAMYREPGVSLMRLAMHLDARGVPTPSGTPRWSCATVRGILRNPAYTGQVYAQRTRYCAPTHRRSATHPIGRPHGTAVPQPADTWVLVGQVPAVASRAQFEEVQAKLATNRPFARRNNTAHRYLLRALVSCGCCGLACMGRVNGRYAYYTCNGKQQSTYSHRAACCSARQAPVGQLDELVWQDVCALLSAPEPLAAAVARAHSGAWLPQELLARRETLRRGRAHLHQQLERLTDAYLRAVIPLDEYERRRRELEQRVQALAGQEEQLRDDAERQRRLADLAASLEAFRQRVQRGLAQASFEQRRELVMLLIDRVVITNADVEIRYALPTSPESEHVRFCHLRKDYFHLPTLDEPADDLQRHPALVGAEQRLRVEAPMRVAQQHPADRHDRHAGVAPDGGAGVDLHDPLALAVPARHGHAPPRRAPIGQHLGERRQAPALGPGAADRSGAARRRRLVEGGVEAETGDAGHAAPDEGGQKLEGGEPAVGHQHHLAPRHPSPGLQDQLAPPLGQPLVAPAVLAAGPLRGGERRQERQGPGPPGPGDRNQQHQADPAQPAGLDEVARRGADGVAVDALGADALAAPALDGVVEAEEDRAARREGIEQQPEEDARRRLPAPGGAVEHPVIADEPPFAREAADPQDGGHGARPGRQDGADQQHLGVPPTPLAEERREA
jgi:site-specific DNA recombinase